MSKRFISSWTAALLIALLVASSGQGQAASIPQGTQVQVRLLNQLDTGETQSGQTFSASVLQPVVVGGKTVLPRGAKVSGRVIEAVSSGRLKRPASITVELTKAGGAPLRTDPLRIDGKSHLLRNVALIGGSAAAGALIGGALGGKKGAATGAAVGAGAGTATAYVTGKKEIVLPAELALTFVVGGGAGRTAAAAASRAEPEPEASAPDESVRGDDRGGPMAEARETALMFSERDQQLIHNYLRANPGSLPPGLAKRGGRLPPGLEKQLRRKGSLPPGLQKRYGAEPLPVKLSGQLPPLPSGYSRLIVAGRAVILDRNHNILDIMAIIR